MELKEFIQKIDELTLSNTALKEYVDKEVQERDPNFWDIIEYGTTQVANKKSAHEIRYSRMLKWLMDPMENHHLGNFFAKSLVESVYGDTGEDFSDDVADDQIFCQTERDKIDVYYQNQSKNVHVAIEVKQYAEEHNRSNTAESQLTYYEKMVDRYAKDIELKTSLVPKTYFIFLTPDAVEAQDDSDIWVSIGYPTVIDILKQSLSLNSGLDYTKIIKDFISDLQHSLMHVEFASGKDELRSEIKAIEKEVKKYSSMLDSDDTSEEYTNYRKAIFELDKKEKRISAAINILNSTIIYKQDHRRNSQVQAMIQKIIAYYTDKEDVQPGEIVEIGERYRDVFAFRKIRRTRGKGQGLHIFEDEQFRSKGEVYTSGDGQGWMINDYLGLGSKERKSNNEKEFVYKTKLLKKNYCKVEELENEAAFQDFMEKFTQSLVELSQVYRTWYPEEKSSN